MKKEVNNLCKIKARKLIDDQIQPLKRKMQQGSFQSIDEVYSELSRLKDEYQGPKFKNLDVLLQEATNQTLIKACDYFTVNQEQS